jgi:hypothetical protein
MTADDLLRNHVIAKYRESYNNHLAQCIGLTVAELDANDSTYGCDTGCEYVRLESVLTCPHGERVDYDWGDFGELAWLIEELEAREKAGG